MPQAIPVEASELEALKRDAARYRWLREKHDGGDEQWFLYGGKSDSLDEDVDRAMEAEANDEHRQP